MANLDSARKLRTYHIIYRLNLSFANIVAHCRLLQEGGLLNSKTARRYQSFVQELQAEINQSLTEIMESVESEDHFRFGKMRQEWEKEICDPDDIFLQAEERRKELAKHRKQKGLSKTKKTKKSRPKERQAV
jgi:hypothetical protein